MKKTIYASVLILVLLVVALLVSYANAPSLVDTYPSYKDAAYEIDGKWVVLGTEGTKYFGNEAIGDLNGDNRPDTAFLFTREPGGSGTFYYVAVALGTGNGYTGTNAVLLGDRIAPQNTSIEEEDVIVNYADRDGSAPMTTKPSIGVTSYFKIVDGRLVYEGSF